LRARAAKTLLRALCKAFELLEEGPEEVGCKEPAGVRFIVEKVKEGYEA
jgi:hypothetical protein